MESTQSTQIDRLNSSHLSTVHGSQDHNSHLEFRCPHCQKLYMTELEEISQGPSYFECFDCHTLFGLEQSENIKGEKVYSSFSIPAAHEAALPGLEILEETPMLDNKMQSCPKCGCLAQVQAKECYSCGVIFERYRLAHGEDGQVIHPSMARRWREIVGDFGNAQLHEEFLKLCQSLESLPYARQKYQEIKNLQGQDADCDKYLKKIDGLLKIVANKREIKAAAKKAEKASFWKKALLASPFVFSFALILVGSLGGASRNLVGVGISFAMMVFGMIYLIQKRLS